MTVGLIEAISSAVADELNDLAGYRVTRLTTSLLPEAREQTGIGTLDYDGATALTLTGGAWIAGLATPMIVRLIDGPYVGEEAEITSRDSDTTATLTAPFPSATLFTGASFEVVTPAQAVAQVEVLLDWPTEGEVRIDAVRYRFSSRTLTTLEGLEHWDGEAWVAGAAQRHEPLAEVWDANRTYSDMDLTRRAFQVDWATGEDLNEVGIDVGVFRPPELADDDTYREVIKAMAFTPAGTMYSIELLLDAVLGAGNYELFEDMTLDAAGRSIRHPCTVYLRGTGAGGSEDFVGRTFLEGEEEVVSDGASTLTLAEEPLRVHGVTLANEGGPERLVAEGTGLSSADGGQTATLASGTFPTNVIGGDVLILTSEQAQGAAAAVVGTAGAVVTLGNVEGFSQISAEADGSIGFDFVGLDWKIIREKDSCREELLSDQALIELPGTAPVTRWTEQGDDLSPTVGIDVRGSRTIIPHSSTATYTGFRRPLRIEPSSDAEIGVLLDTAGIADLDDCLQSCLVVSDGERAIGVGVDDNASGDRIVSFCDPSDGSQIGFALGWENDGATPGTYTVSMNEWRIVKRGRDAVQLWHRAWNDGVAKPLTLVDEVAYTDFPTIATYQGAAPYTPLDREVFIGSLTSANIGQVSTYLKWIDFKTSNLYNYWNERYTDGVTTAGVQQIDSATATFVAGDIGKTIRVHTAGATNAAGGTATREWEIEGVPSGTEATVVGRTEQGGDFAGAGLSFFQVRDQPKAFRWPDDLGHQVEILEGTNLGIYTITDIIDADTLLPVDENMPDTQAQLGTLANYEGLGPIYSNIVLLDTAGGVPARPSGFDVSLSEVEWRLLPVFGTDSAMEIEVTDRGSITGAVVTSAQALPMAVGQLYTVQRSEVLTAQLLDVRETNEFLDPTHTHYPFYLYDQFGFLADYIADLLTAAGVIPDFDSFIRDSTGAHIV